MIPRVVELGSMLEVSQSDLKTMKHMKRQRFLEKAAHIAVPAVSAVAGLLAADLAVPVREPAPYPFGPMISAAPAVALSSRRSWAATVIVSFVLFVLAFTILAWINTGINGSFGISSKYGVFSRES
jgi:hypothetical protein